MQHNGAVAYALEYVLTVSYSDIRATGAPFNGAHLFVAHIPEVHRLFNL